MSGWMFRIPSSHVDVGFIDACAAFLTPKMALSQVRPSGCSLHRVAIEPTPTCALPERPSASSYYKEDRIAVATTMSTDLVTPVFQPLRGGTGRRWEAIEYGIATDNSSLISADSAAEREDTDEEIMSFDLGPEPFDQLVQDRLPLDEYLDDLQQGLIPGGSEPRTMMEYEPATDEMPVTRQSLIKTMRQDMEAAIDAQEDTPMSPERAPEPVIGFSYDYQTDSPPTMAKRYMPATDDLTPPISLARAEARPAYPAPVQCPGRGRGRGWWRAQSRETPGVGTRSMTRQSLWPEKPDKSLLITRMTRDLRLQDPPEDRHRIDENQNEVRPLAAGFHSHHRDVFIIPPPRAGGGAAGASTPVSTAPLGLIHHYDPLLATQLREDPDSLAVRDTCLRVLATIHKVRTGLVAQLAALTQWEEAIHSQGGQ